MAPDSGRKPSERATILESCSVQLEPFRFSLITLSGLSALKEVLEVLHIKGKHIENDHRGD